MQFHMLALFSGISSLISSNKRSLFPPPSLSRLREAPPTVFPRYGVSRFSLPNTRPLTANEKDPSASLGMTIRETCFPLFFYLALVIHPADRHFERSEKSFSSPFSHDSFVKPFTGSTVPAFPAIRCFPFLAVGHTPFYRQRKRSLGFARDDDTGNVLSSFLLPCIGYSSRRPSFRAQREIFFVPLFHDSFAMPFTGSTVPAFPAIRCFPFFAIGHSPSCRQRKRSLDDDTGNVLSQHNLFPIYGNAHFPPFY